MLQIFVQVIIQCSQKYFKSQITTKLQISWHLWLNTTSVVVMETSLQNSFFTFEHQFWLSIKSISPGKLEHWNNYVSETCANWCSKSTYFIPNPQWPCYYHVTLTSGDLENNPKWIGSRILVDTDTKLVFLCLLGHDLRT